MAENSAQELAEIRRKFKELLVSELNLEGVKAEDLKDNTVLFGEGLGLDSLDAVEIVVLLQRHFGVDVRDMAEGQKVFYSIETITNFIQEARKAKGS